MTKKYANNELPKQQYQRHMTEFETEVFDESIDRQASDGSPMDEQADVDHSTVADTPEIEESDSAEEIREKLDRSSRFDYKQKE
jgi:hypothetical protein